VLRRTCSLHVGYILPAGFLPCPLVVLETQTTRARLPPFQITRQRQIDKDLKQTAMEIKAAQADKQVRRPSHEQRAARAAAMSKMFSRPQHGLEHAPAY